MGNFILKILIKGIIGRILSNVHFDHLIDFVGRAEKDYDNSFKKRGAVYQAIKGMEPESVSQYVINLAIELGVYAYKKKLM